MATTAQKTAADDLLNNPAYGIRARKTWWDGILRETRAAAVALEKDYADKLAVQKGFQRLAKNTTRLEKTFRLVPDAGSKSPGATGRAFSSRKRLAAYLNENGLSHDFATLAAEKASLKPPRDLHRAIARRLVPDTAYRSVSVLRNRDRVVRDIEIALRAGNFRKAENIAAKARPGFFCRAATRNAWVADMGALHGLIAKERYKAERLEKIEKAEKKIEDETAKMIRGALKNKNMIALLSTANPAISGFVASNPALTFLRTHHTPGAMPTLQQIRNDLRTYNRANPAARIGMEDFRKAMAAVQGFANSQHIAAKAETGVALRRVTDTKNFQHGCKLQRKRELGYNSGMVYVRAREQLEDIASLIVNVSEEDATGILSRVRALAAKRVNEADVETALSELQKGSSYTPGAAAVPGFPILSGAFVKAAAGKVYRQASQRLAMAMQ